MDVHDTEMFDGEWNAAQTEERRANLLGAKLFADACAAGDVDRMFEAVDFLNERTVDGWRRAMLRVGLLTSVSAEIRAAFLPIWIESKTFSRRVTDRPALASALRVLMAAGYTGEPLHLYRGAGTSDRRTGTYGFSWTKQIDTARHFADLRRISSGGSVVMEALAPPEAIFFVREDEGYYDEGEVVVDPFRLERVRVMEC